MDFFESKKSIDLIDVSINQSSLQISTNLVPQQLSKPNLEFYQFVKIHVVQQHIQFCADFFKIMTFVFVSCVFHCSRFMCNYVFFVDILLCNFLSVVT